MGGVTLGMLFQHVEVMRFAKKRRQVSGERIDEVFKHHWNTQLRKWVETRIQEEVADQATLLGKRLGELAGKRGTL